jgi:hypothetical protein
MFSKALVTATILLAITPGAGAQQPDVTIDLDALARRPALKIFVAGATFAASQTECPHAQAILQFSAGSLIQHRLVSPREGSDWRVIVRPLDDETYLLGLAIRDCAFGITVRQQVRRSGVWTSLPIPRDVRQRPSAGFGGESRESKDSGPRTPSPPLVDPLGTLLTFGNGQIARGARSEQTRFEFEGSPRSCVSLVASYAVTRNAVAFELISLPDAANNFSVNSQGIDDYRGRVFFIRDDCRFEFVVAKSLRYADQWLAVPLVRAAQSERPWSPAPPLGQPLPVPLPEPVALD